MATILEQYQKKSEDYQSQIAASSFPPDELMALQEMNYRMCVLQTVQAMLRVAPITTDLQVIADHFLVVCCYMDMLTKERKFGPKMDDAQKQKRDTALNALEQVVQDGKKRFMSFRAPNQDIYKSSIKNYCNAVLSMWMQYRDTYIKI